MGGVSCGRAAVCGGSFWFSWDFFVTAVWDASSEMGSRLEALRFILALLDDLPGVTGEGLLSRKPP